LSVEYNAKNPYIQINLMTITWMQQERQKMILEQGVEEEKEILKEAKSKEFSEKMKKMAS
jgi:hypothetical protein